MSFRATFNHTHAVLPVIHVTDANQAVRNAEIAAAAGADGVFLIDHKQSLRTLFRCYTTVRNALPDLWVGVNMLGLHAHEAFHRIQPGTAGLWADHAGIDDDRLAQPQAVAAAAARAATNFTGLYFGGVAFKYQRPVTDPAAAARVASEFVDVVTTSGSATGRAAAIQHVCDMRSALGAHPLALASGVTADNVLDYVEHVDAFLVASGISRDFHELDPYLTAKLTDVVRSCT